MIKTIDKGTRNVDMIAEKKNARMVKFIRKIAKLERGCAPSVGFFEEIIEEARKIINE